MFWVSDLGRGTGSKRCLRQKGRLQSLQDTGINSFSLHPGMLHPFFFDAPPALGQPARMCCVCACARA